MEKGKFKSVGFGFCGLVLASAITLSGCGGGGGGGSTTTTTTTTTGTGSSLQMAEKISVVDAKSSTSPAAGLRVGKFKVAPSTVTATGTDWSKDVTQVYVHERSEEAFGTINEILCMVGQTQYDEMVNKGDYKALVDKNQCSSKRDSAESAGKDSGNQSSGSTSPDYETWTVNSSRADSNAGTPQYVKVWVHEKEKKEGNHTEPAKVIEAKVTITEGVSSTNPYGLFTMSFAAYPVINGTKASTAMFKGVLLSEKDSNGKVLLKFAMDGGFTNPQGIKEQSMTEKSVLDRAADGSTGSGSAFHSYSSPWGGDKGSFNMAFNTANFLRQETTGGTSGNKVCLDRASYDETAWRYGLYNADGKRVVRNSGFPITYNGNFGWAGYYGLWLPDSASIPDGATVKKQVFSSTGTTEADYTLIKKGGKLKKHTQKMLTLADVKNLPLDYNEMSQTGPGTNYRVVWNGSAFNKVAKQSQTSYMWEDLTTTSTPPVNTPIDLTTLQWGELNFWSQSLGGQVRVKLDSCTFNNTTFKTSCSAGAATVVVFYAEDIVYPGDTVPAAFRCYDNCPTYDATNGVAGSGWSTNPNNPTAYDYTFDASASGMILKDGSSNSLLMTQASGTNQWGYMSGPLFEASTANLAALACDWDNTKTCGWKAWSVLTVFYTWETGTQQWNQFTALQGPSPATTIVRFDAPLQVTYTHSQANSAEPDYKYNGVKFYLEYAGFGDLHGIPGVCVDMDSGQPVSCGPNTRWVPEFMITEGAEAVNGSTYYIKPLEKEQRMTKVAESSCSALTLTSYTLPDISLWSDPALGTEPTITGAPAVIGGVLQ